MDLALALGQPVGALANQMSEREFIRWHRYAAKRLLPWQRMEWYLAQIAWLIAATMGGRTNASITDYLIQTRDDASDEEADDPEELLAQAIVAFDVKPRTRRKKDGNG